MSLLWSPRAENGLGQFDDRVADVGALTAQVVRGGVDERAQRADSAGFGGLQVLGELLQLFAEIVPFHRNRGAVLRHHGAVGHLRSPGVAGVNWIARDVISCGDRITALASAGTLYLLVEPERDLGPLRLRFDLVDLADRHAEDVHVVAGEDAVAVVEVRDARGCGRSLPYHRRRRRSGLRRRQAMRSLPCHDAPHRRSAWRWPDVTSHVGR